MKTLNAQPIGILFATKEGHTHKIAAHIADRLGARGYLVEVFNVEELPATRRLNNFSAVILAASVHAGHHEEEMVEFVRTHRHDLEVLPTAFLSVTLSQAGAERRKSTEEERARFSADVEELIGRFFEETNWHPARVKAVAGALLYSKYNILIRFLMKRIAKKVGAETDTSHDYVYTDWGSLDAFVEGFISETGLTPELPSESSFKRSA